MRSEFDNDNVMAIFQYVVILFISSGLLILTEILFDISVSFLELIVTIPVLTLIPIFIIQKVCRFQIYRKIQFYYIQIIAISSPLLIEILVAQISSILQIENSGVRLFNSNIELNITSLSMILLLSFGEEFGLRLFLQPRICIK